MFDSWQPSLFQLILFAVGGGLVYLGQEWGVPGTTDVGTLFLGLLVAVVGGGIGWRRAQAFRADGWANVVDSYRGVLELIWAALLLCAGLLIMCVPIVGWLVPGGAGNLIGNMLSSTTGIGIVMATSGLILSLNGIIRALAGSGSGGSKRLGALGRALDRLAGAIVCTFGLAVALGGLFLLIAPGWVNGVLQQLRGVVVTP
jgi:hypothetical protein